MSRRTLKTIAKRNEFIVHRRYALKAEQPFLGYRRIWAHLWFVVGRQINKKRVLRLMRQHGLRERPYGTAHADPQRRTPLAP